MPTGKEQFGRRWAVTVNTTRITELDVSFKIEKSLKDEPNKCELKIINLTEDMRAAIEELNPQTTSVSSLAKSKAKVAARKQATTGIPCQIEAGYGDDDKDLALLWLGDIRSAKSERAGTDWITTLESGDGEKAWQNARVNVSFGPQTPVDTALRAIVKSLGIGDGNVARAAAALRATGKMFTQGTVLSGPAAQHLTAFCKSADLEWSIQDGALQIVERGKALAQEALKITSDTGMLGSPSVDVDGILTVKVQMMPDVRPGRLVVIDSRRIKGNYRIEKCEWNGDTSGDTWEITIEARRY